MVNLRYVNEPPKELKYRNRPESGDIGSKLSLEHAEHIAEIFQTPLTGAYNWDYETANEKLRRLYELGKQLNWDAQTDIDWSIPPLNQKTQIPIQDEFFLAPFMGWEPFEALSDEQKMTFRWHALSWGLSQFVHGEQGALLVASQLVTCAPTEEAKLYAASQTFDEARHVEVYHKYLVDRIGWWYPVDKHLKALLDKVLTDPRWDLKFVGMQIVIESLALAAFNLLKQMSYDPVLRQVTEYVLRDESRHVAFGVMFLEDFVKTLPPEEIEARAQFTYEAAVLMRERLVPSDPAVRLFGWDEATVRSRVLDSYVMEMFRDLLFERLIPNIKKIGLLTDTVRPLYEKMGVMKFEDLRDDGQIEWLEASMPFARSQKAATAEKKPEIIGSQHSRLLTQ